MAMPFTRDRVEEPSAMPLLGPIFELCLCPEQYGYGPERSAPDAVKCILSLRNTGRNEDVFGDLYSFFGETPHCKQMRSVACHVSEGREVQLMNAWLETPVEVDDGAAANTTRTGCAEGGRRPRSPGEGISATSTSQTPCGATWCRAPCRIWCCVCSG